MLPIALTIVSVLLVIALIGCVVLWRGREAALAAAESAGRELDQMREANASLDKDVAVLREKLANDEQRLADLKEQQAEVKRQIEDHLQALASKALSSTNTEFLKLAGEKLTPITSLLKRYDEQYQKIEQSRKQEYGGLSAVTQSLKSQTEALVTALRRPEVRGRWGEIALRRIAELAGMTDRCDFTEQAHVETEGGRLRPDMVVRLPNQRTIVVDAKVVLDAFMEAVRLPEGDERSAKMAQHVGQINEQIKKLSGKAYTEQFDRSPDFTVLFIPVESALYGAMESDGELLERAFRQKVVIATPTLLIALLKSVELGWHEQRLAENAEELRALGEELHERISKSLGDVVKLGRSLGGTVKDFNTLVGSVDVRLMPTLRKFEAAGGRSAKELPGAVEPVDVTPREVKSEEAAGAAAGESAGEEQG